MRRLQTRINTQSSEFRQYRAHNQQILTAFRQKQKQARFQPSGKGYSAFKKPE